MKRKLRVAQARQQYARTLFGIYYPPYTHTFRRKCYEDCINDEYKRCVHKKKPNGKYAGIKRIYFVSNGETGRCVVLHDDWITNLKT